MPNQDQLTEPQAEIFVLTKRKEYIEQALETFTGINPLDTLDEVSLRIALKNTDNRIKNLKNN